MRGESLFGAGEGNPLPRPKHLTLMSINGTIVLVSRGVRDSACTAGLAGTNACEGECKSKPEWKPGRPVAREAGTHVREGGESRPLKGDERMSNGSGGSPGRKGQRSSFSSISSTLGHSGRVESSANNTAFCSAMRVSISGVSRPLGASTLSLSPSASTCTPKCWRSSTECSPC